MQTANIRPFRPEFKTFFTFIGPSSPILWRCEPGFCLLMSSKFQVRPKKLLITGRVNSPLWGEFLLDLPNMNFLHRLRSLHFHTFYTLFIVLICVRVVTDCLIIFEKFHKFPSNVVATAQLDSYFVVGHLTWPGELTLYDLGSKFSQQLRTIWGIRWLERGGGGGPFLPADVHKASNKLTWNRSPIGCKLKSNR